MTAAIRSDYTLIEQRHVISKKARSQYYALVIKQTVDELENIRYG